MDEGGGSLCAWGGNMSGVINVSTRGEYMVLSARKCKERFRGIARKQPQETEKGICTLKVKTALYKS